MYALTSFRREDTTLAKKRSAMEPMEPIRLRNLNLGTSHQQTAFAKSEIASKILIDPLRRPEPAVIHSRCSRRMSIGYSTLNTLGDVKDEFNAPSPSLGHTLGLCGDRFYQSSKPIRMCDGALLNVSSDRTFDDRGFDCQPFFHTYNYESRFGRDDYESVINKLIADEMNNTRPVFQEELQFLEMQRMLKSSDYIMFYVFGIDRLGYFKLKRERETFQSSFFEAYTRSLRYGENDSSESDSRPGDEESSSTFNTDDAPDDGLLDPPV